MKLFKRMILKRPAEKRLIYFYTIVSMDEQVWLLRDENGDLLTLEEEDDFEFSLPVWPRRSFAEMEAEVIGEKYEAFNIPLNEFLDDLLVEIEKDNGVAAIFPSEKGAILQTRDEIKEMLRNI
ncbi:DUF2750 domain-containing protein [Niallia taxi]|uniref:DUF2750 domain-containing protein n=1 Tax=Niallia taxi TaxID=2499688 RepID=A0A3S2UBZ2_9BACI|nr:DUF2750 domain-containing protein [Niallia taxi]MCM3212938.1 DUF2750 domain-containing protein [Niallia taxi]MED4041270.1 DUF2750 domain-containing protein [Niallia taxi]RVT56329.1 DUF2750 domain-containing protein [Niallia taxi]